MPKDGGTISLDILGITAAGWPVLVECKLWRNPQARREVVGQRLEYAALLRAWSYADLTARLRVKLGTAVANPLFDLVRCARPDLDLHEARFIDAASGWLRSLTLAPTADHAIYAGMVDETDETEQQALEAQMQAATDAIRATVLRLLREDAAHPQLIVLAVARVAGELGASAALAGGQDAEELLNELAEVVRQAGRDHQEVLRAEALPVAGNA